MVRVHWGVDSSQSVTKTLYDCVLNNYGKPEFWGRYLTRVEGAAEGLTKAEIELLHKSGTKLLPIYNDFRAAVGEREGRAVAVNATYNAKRLGIRLGVPIFANVERFFEVDSNWIRGYVNYMYISGYKPGIYHDPRRGGFSAAYCDAVNQDKQVADQAIFWSAHPEPGVTKARQAPQYKPAAPPCKANVWAWQYGRDAGACPIDTNLADSRLFQILY